MEGEIGIGLFGGVAEELINGRDLFLVGFWGLERALFVGLLSYGVIGFWVDGLEFIFLVVGCVR